MRSESSQNGCKRTSARHRQPGRRSNKLGAEASPKKTTKTEVEKEREMVAFLALRDLGKAQKNTKPHSRVLSASFFDLG